MTETRHLIVEGSSSSVDNGGAGPIPYPNLYLPQAIQETNQQSFATDGALLSDMLARQSSVIAAFKDGLNILFVQAGQNDLISTDAPVWLAAFTAYLEEGGHTHQSKCLRLDSKRWEYKAASPSEQQPGLSSEYKQGRKRPPG